MIDMFREHWYIWSWSGEWETNLLYTPFQVYASFGLTEKNFMDPMVSIIITKYEKISSFSMSNFLKHPQSIEFEIFEPFVGIVIERH